MAVVHNYSIDHNKNGGNPVCVKQCSSRSLRQQTFRVYGDGDQPGGKCQTKWARVCACRRTCAISGRGSVIFGDWRRGAVTACGLGTEGPVFFLESGGGARVDGAGGLLWTARCPAASLWLTVELNWMSEAVSIKSTTYRSLWSRLHFSRPSIVSLLIPEGRIFLSFG